MTTKRANRAADRAFATVAAKRKTENTGAIDVLDMVGIERLCDLCADGKSRGEIAAELGTSRRMLSYWLAKDEARHRMFLDAERTKADWHADEALRVLTDLPPAATRDAVARAKEIANHHRWAAEKFDRRRYGNQVTVEHKEAPASEMSDADLHARIDELLGKTGHAGVTLQ